MSEDGSHDVEAADLSAGTVKIDVSKVKGFEHFVIQVDCRRALVKSQSLTLKV